VWLYIEGAFHNTTAFLNGQPIGSHQAAYGKQNNNNRNSISGAFLRISQCCASHTRRGAAYIAPVYQFDAVTV